MKNEPIQVGDFAYCRSKRYRDSLQLPREPGVVIETKGATYKILFASDRRAWIPRDTLVRIEPAADLDPLLRTLNFLMRRVNAHECEVSSNEGTHRLAMRIEAIDYKLMDELRTFLGNRCVSLVVAPEGMAFMQLEITFQ